MRWFKTMLTALACMVLLGACAGAEEAFVLQVADKAEAGQTLHVTWEACPGADNYLLELVSDGRCYAYIWMDTDLEEDVPVIFPAQEYELRVSAYMPEMDEEDWPRVSRPLTVTGELGPGPEVRAEGDTVQLEGRLGFHVNSAGAQQVLINHSGVLSPDIYPAAGDVTRVEKGFYSTGTYELYFAVCRDGVWTGLSGPIVVMVAAGGTLETQVSAPEFVDVSAGEVEISWRYVPEAEDYYVEFNHEESGEGRWRTVKAENANRQGDVITLVQDMDGLPAGEWRVRVRPRAEGYESKNAWATFIMGGEMPPAPELRVNRTSVLAGVESVVVTTDLTGAEAWQLKRDGEIQEERSAQQGELWWTLEQPTDLTCRVKREGVWSAWSETVHIDVNYYGALTAPAVEMKEEYTAGEPIAISWEAVENAEVYYLELILLNERYLGRWEVKGTSCSVPFDVEPGDYLLAIEPQARGYDNRSTRVERIFTVSEGTLLPGPTLQVDNASPVRRTDVTFTVEMPGATRFRIDTGRNEVTEVEAQNGRAVLVVNRYTDAGKRTCKAAALVDGVWTAYGPELIVDVQTDPRLATPVFTAPVTGRAGEDIIVDCIWPEGMTSADIRVVTLDGEELPPRYEVNSKGQYYLQAGFFKPGRYQLRVAAYGSGYRGSEYGYGELIVQEPAPENIFRVSVYSGSITICDYLKSTMPEELVIPQSLQGKPVTAIADMALVNDGSLKRVVIPGSVTSIGDDVFRGSTGLTVCGETGSYAELYALTNGLGFESTNGGRSPMSVSWKKDVLVNERVRFTVSGASGKDVRVTRGSGDSMVAREASISGGKLTFELEFTEPGLQSIWIRVRKNGAWVSAAVAQVDVKSLGSMPVPENLSLSASQIEPAEAITLSWAWPEGVDALDYYLYSTKLKTNILDENSIPWVTIRDKAVTTLSFSQLETGVQGEYTVFIRVPAKAGYEVSYTALSFSVASTKEYDAIPELGVYLSYNGDEKHVVIPEEIDGHPITIVYDQAFYEKDVYTVQLPDAVKYIGDFAFYGNQNMRQVTLPAGLTTLGYEAFAECRALLSIEIPAGVRKLPARCFYNCDSLTEVKLPGMLREMSFGVFGHCDALEELVLPETLEYIDSAIVKPGCVLVVKRDTYAMEYAQSSGEEYRIVD